MFTRWAVVAALLGFLGGCGTSVGAPANPAAQTVQAGGSRLHARIQVAPPQAGYRTMAVIRPYKADDIDHLVFELWRVSDSGDVLEGTMQTPSGSKDERTVDWSHLKRNTTYKLKVSAISESGEVLNEGGTTTVHQVSTGSDDQVSVDIALRLADRVFDGRLHPVVRATSISESQVDHLYLELKEKVGGSWISQDVQSTPGGSGLSKTVDFIHLKRNTQYRLVVKAIRSNGKMLKTKTVDVETEDDDEVSVNVNL